MKEAAGEANLTVVAIILIASIAAIVTPIITSMMNTTKKRACCMDAGGTLSNNQCVDCSVNQLNYDKNCSGASES